MSVSVTLKSYFYEVLIPSSQKNTSSPIEDILHHVSISFMKKLALYKCFNPRTHTGCDFSLFFIYLIIDVSIHAPTRGATFIDLFNIFNVFVFQSTHPHGVRLATSNEVLQLQHVSIHAPTRGATSDLHDAQPKRQGFNPRTHTGCDTMNPENRTLKQSFNPRTHTGCDSMSVSAGNSPAVSIHAPTRGATVCKVTYYKSIN